MEPHHPPLGGNMEPHDPPLGGNMELHHPPLGGNMECPLINLLVLRPSRWQGCHCVQTACLVFLLINPLMASGEDHCTGL
jgi:hypothetical protein